MMDANGVEAPESEQTNQQRNRRRGNDGVNVTIYINGWNKIELPSLPDFRKNVGDLADCCLGA